MYTINLSSVGGKFGNMAAAANVIDHQISSSEVPDLSKPEEYKQCHPPKRPAPPVKTLFQIPQPSPLNLVCLSAAVMIDCCLDVIPQCPTQLLWTRNFPAYRPVKSIPMIHIPRINVVNPQILISCVVERYYSLMSYNSNPFPRELCSRYFPHRNKTEIGMSHVLVLFWTKKMYLYWIRTVLCINQYVEGFKFLLFFLLCLYVFRDMWMIE